MRSKRAALCSLAILILAPLAGGLSAGFTAGFFSFPPVLIKLVQPEPFSLIIFVAFGILEFIALAIFVRPKWFGFRIVTTDVRPVSRFPWWGWAGLGLTLLSWACSWIRFEWLGLLANYTFTPLWIGYIFVMDGLVFRRVGSSVLSKSPTTFAGMFVASSVIWWYFEFLNRFVKNWWYEGADAFDVAHYIFFASASFSTVLPAILETSEWLSSHGWFQTAYAQGPKWKLWPRWAFFGVTVMGVGGLVLLAIFPERFFCLTWLAPLAVLAGSFALAGEETPFDRLHIGDYRQLFSLAAAAVVCGFFWEMWNYWSMPKWHYAVPYVQALHVFEMPLVGFTGYLPFGPICWLLWRALQGIFAVRAR